MDKLTLLTIADINSIQVVDNTIGIIYIDNKGWTQGIFSKGQWRNQSSKTKIIPKYIMVNISPLDALAINLGIKKQDDGTFKDNDNNVIIKSELGYSILSNIILP